MIGFTTAQQHLDQALEYENQGRLDEALDECDLAIELEPKLAEAYNTRAIILEQLGAINSAIRDYQIALELEPSSEIAAQNLFDALEEAAWIRRKRVLLVALVGGVAFGFCFMLAHVVDAAFFDVLITGVGPGGIPFTSTKLGVIQSIIADSILLSLGVGLGTGLLATLLGTDERRLLVIFSFIGFGFFYSIIAIGIGIAKLLGAVTFFTRSVYIITSIIQFAVPGAFTGLLFALISGNSRHLLIASLAGSSIGVIGLYDAYQLVVIGSSWTDWIPEAYELFRSAYLLGYDPQRDLNITRAMYQGLRGLIGGSVFGFVLGMVLSIVSTANQIDIVEQEFDLLDE